MAFTSSTSWADLRPGLWLEYSEGAFEVTIPLSERLSTIIQRGLSEAFTEMKAEEVSTAPAAGSNLARTTGHPGRAIGDGEGKEKFGIIPS